MSNVVEDIYRSACVLGLTHHVEQWGALANIAQYRLPFEKTDRWFAAHDTVLGNGHFSYFLTQRGIRTVGLSFEPSPPMLSSEPRFQHVRHSDPISLPFADATFDAAVSVGVLEHVHETGGDQRASLVELARVLKPGGALLVFHLPNRYSWIECLVRSVNPWLRRPVFQHSMLFTRADVERLLPPSLSIIECGRYNIIPRNPANALPAWPLRRPSSPGSTSLTTRSRRSRRCSPKTGSSCCGSAEPGRSSTTRLTKGHS
ncbi:MAG: class I SAM-dependent methyltransferase [Planctomycetia bacterium]|nr:class I SAM-dependent methyltransferase [Planctomycetia bacterium]